MSYSLFALLFVTAGELFETVRSSQFPNTSSDSTAAIGRTKEPTFQALEQLWCDDTGTPLYQFVEASYLPETIAEAKRFCDLNGKMSLCTLNDLVQVYDNPARHWMTNWAIVDTDPMTVAMLQMGCDFDDQLCFEKISMDNIANMEDGTFLHCCQLSNPCNKTSSPDPTLETLEALWCEDTYSTVYQYAQDSMIPYKVKDMKRHCNTENMNLCTLDELVTVYYAPNRDWKTRWAVADDGTDDRVEAEIGDSVCSYSDKCYKDVVFTDNAADYRNKIHCCTDDLSSCKSIRNGLAPDQPTTTTIAPATTTGAPPTTAMAPGEVVVIVDIPLEDAPEIFK